PRLLDRALAVVRLDAVAVLSFVQWHSAPRVGYRPCARSQIDLYWWLDRRRGDCRPDFGCLDRRDSSLDFLTCWHRGCARRSAVQSGWARRKRGSSTGGPSALARLLWCR